MTCENGRYFIHEGFDVLDAHAGVVVLHTLHNILHLPVSLSVNYSYRATVIHYSLGKRNYYSALQHVLSSLYILKTFWQKNCRVAEWLALRTSRRGDPSSIPAEVKPFFGGKKTLEQHIACRFELNFNFKLN